MITIKIIIFIMLLLLLIVILYLLFILSNMDAYHTMHIFIMSSGLTPFSFSSQGSKITAAASSIP